jgi:serine phosphatase RsbU (regulator of sigma subunit)
MIKRIAYILTFFCFVVTVQAQKDSVRVKELNEIAKAYFNANTYDSARYYVELAKDLAKKVNFKKGLAYAHHLLARIELFAIHNDLVIKNEQIALKLRKEIGDSMGVCDSYNIMGHGYFNMGDYALTVKHYSAALSVARNVDDKIGMGFVYGSFGDFYNVTGNQAAAIDAYYEALKLQTAAGNRAAVADCYNDIGSIQKDRGSNAEALKNLYTAIEIYTEFGNKIGVAYAYNNIGLMNQDQKNYKKALDNFEMGFKLTTEANDTRGQAICLNNIGNIYSLTNRHEESVQTFLKLIKLREEIRDKHGLSSALLNLAAEYLREKKYDLAEQYCLKALVPAKEFNITQHLAAIHLSLSDAYAGKKQYEASLANYKRYKTLSDSVTDVSVVKRAEQARLNYEFGKKEAIERGNQEKKDAVQKEELERQKIMRYMFTGGFILTLLIVGIIFRSLQMNKRKNRIITEQKAEVEKQKHVIEHQKELVEEKQKEVMDSIHYAKRIQGALLASDALLNQNLPEYFVLFKPKDVVSGDFYWALKHGESFYMAAADSTGHGVPGAFMSLLNISFLTEAINVKQIQNPDEILNYTRSRLIKALQEDGSQEGGKDGMDCILSVFDFKRNKMEYAAANNSFYILRNRELITCSADKMPVGRSPLDHQPFTKHSVDLQKGDIVYMLTDGFPDQFGGVKGKKYKYKQLEELILANGDKPLKEQREIYNLDFETWKGDLEQVDDVLLIGVKIS